MSSIKVTIEDAAKNHAGIPLNRIVDSEERYFNSSTREYDSFIEGANYIEKTMYSEEEVLKILESHKDVLEFDKDRFNHDEWFEQFKK